MTAIAAVGVAAAIDTTAKNHHSLWTSPGFLVAYVAALGAIVCLIGAIREWNFPLARRHTDETTGPMLPLLTTNTDGGSTSSGSTDPSAPPPGGVPSDILLEGTRSIGNASEGYYIDSEPGQRVRVVGAEAIGNAFSGFVVGGRRAALLEITAGTGAPWDHPGYSGRRTKLVGVHNKGSATACGCTAQVTGVEPLPQRGNWLNNEANPACDIRPDDTAYLSLTFQDDGFKPGVEVKVWLVDSSAPVSAIFDVSVGKGVPFPWFNRRTP